MGGELKLLSLRVIWIASLVHFKFSTDSRILSSRLIRLANLKLPLIIFSLIKRNFPPSGEHFPSARLKLIAVDLLHFSSVPKVHNFFRFSKHGECSKKRKVIYKRRWGYFMLNRIQSWKAFGLSLIVINRYSPLRDFHVNYQSVEAFDKPLMFLPFRWNLFETFVRFEFIRILNKFILIKRKLCVESWEWKIIFASFMQCH